MPSIPDFLASFQDEAILVEPDSTVSPPPTLSKRINVPYNTSIANPPGLIEAETVDPWSLSGKYALGWVYFCIILVAFSLAAHLYKIWTDKIRQALHKEEVLKEAMLAYSPATQYEMSNLETDASTNKLFPRQDLYHMSAAPKAQSTVSSISPLNNTIALFRYVFYRPTPVIFWHKGWIPITFPSFAVSTLVLIAFIFVTLYTFVPQPLYWQSIAFGSPPVAIRSGMIAVSMMPWIVLLSTKANLISFVSGIGHERLNVLHRWMGWLCLFLSLIHTIPFYVQPIDDAQGYAVFRSFFNQGIYVFGTGFAALVPLCVLCLHSLPFLRRWMYELFVAVHVPVSIVFLGMMFWHCNNYLTSWNYLFATVGIWLLSYIMRVFYLNWTNPWRLSWLVGDEASIVLMPENAIKVTIPTQTRWRPGQYVYLRVPGISVFENHPFTIASLCNDDFPSEYGEQYRDMILVFRPFGGFTKKVWETALEKGPYHSYRAFIDGPYGGMQRDLNAFDHVVLIAGGSGITALISHLLNLVKRMRDEKAVTRSVHIIWALKRPEVMDWFKEELRICRDFAPPGSVTCQFYITAAKRIPATGQLVSAQTPSRPMSTFFHDKVNDAFQGLADKRASHMSEASEKRRSAFIREDAAGDPEREKELRRENEDGITALPQAHVLPARGASLAGQPHQQPYQQQYQQPYQQQQQQQRYQQQYQQPHQEQQQQQLHPLMAHPWSGGVANRQSRHMTVDVELAKTASDDNTVSYFDPPPPQAGEFNFGFPSTPTEFQKNLMRFAFLPATVKSKDGWSTEYGRPDIPYMLRRAKRDFGRRTCVFVCGPPSMRMDVARTVADMQADVLRDPLKDELYLHTENYAI